jgi:hypothetical protein
MRIGGTLMDAVTKEEITIINDPNKIMTMHEAERKYAEYYIYFIVEQFEDYEPEKSAGYVYAIGKDKHKLYQSVISDNTMSKNTAMLEGILTYTDSFGGIQIDIHD